MKFTINKKTNVRKAFNENGECVAVFGVAGDLLKASILLKVERGCENNIVIVHSDFSVTEHTTIENAKDYLNSLYYINSL